MILYLQQKFENIYLQICEEMNYLYSNLNAIKVILDTRYLYVGYFIGYNLSPEQIYERCNNKKITDMKIYLYSQNINKIIIKNYTIRVFKNNQMEDKIEELKNIINDDIVLMIRAPEIEYDFILRIPFNFNKLNIIEYIDNIQYLFGINKTFSYIKAIVYDYLMNNLKRLEESERDHFLNDNIFNIIRNEDKYNEIIQNPNKYSRYYDQNIKDDIDDFTFFLESYL